MMNESIRNFGKFARYRMPIDLDFIGFTEHMFMYINNKEYLKDRLSKRKR